MRNYTRKMILVIGMLAYGSLCPVMAQETVPPAPETAQAPAPQTPQVDTSSPAVQVFLAHETAIINKDYKKAWDMECASLRRARWKNSFDAFKIFYEMKNKTDSSDDFLKILAVNAVSDKEVHVQAGTGQFFVVVNENGKWCFAGNRDDLYPKK